MQKTFSKTLAVEARDTHGVSYLLASGNSSQLRSGNIPSPFFLLKHCPDTQELQLEERWLLPSSRDIRISLPMKLIVREFSGSLQSGHAQIQVGVTWFDGSDTIVMDDSVHYAITNAASVADIISAGNTFFVNTYAPNVGYTITASDIIWPQDVASQLPSLTAKTFTNPTRSLNSSFQISSTKDAVVSYTVDIAATLSLTSGQTGTVTLQYADDSGMSTNLKTVQSSANGNTGTLTIGLGLTQTSTASLGGVIPAGKYVKIVTTNTTGTPTFTMRAAQEVLM